MNELYQGERRQETKCMTCHARLSFPCMTWKDNEFHWVCTSCGGEFRAKRDDDLKGWKKLKAEMNGK